MATEIERKFLVNKELLPEAAKKITIIQAYLQTDPGRTTRVRITDESAFLTIKGKMVGFSRPEFEYEIPVKDAKELMQLAVSSPIEKVRHLIYVEGRKWEVDFFEGKNQGLVVAEIELPSENEQFDLPVWINEEVTGDIRYHNSYLANHPFIDWE